MKSSISEDQYDSTIENDIEDNGVPIPPPEVTYPEIYNPTVPPRTIDYTNPKNIVQIYEYRFVTDTERTAWNAKLNALLFTPVPDSRTIAGKDTWYSTDYQLCL